VTPTGVLLAATLATEVPDQYEVTPGLTGFLATFAVLVVFLLLVRSFNKNMRKVNANERQRQAEAAEAAQAADAASGEAPVSPSDAEAAAVGEGEPSAVDGEPDVPPTGTGPRG
jgi:predicted lipid-binding transport protein (Tim44 family)